MINKKSLYISLLNLNTVCYRTHRKLLCLFGNNYIYRKFIINYNVKSFIHIVNIYIYKFCFVNYNNLLF